MCGIVGYVGTKPCVPILINGLSRLEYRGYDSAGIAIHTSSGIVIKKCKGRIDDLRKKLANEPLNGTVGIGHTRWATHGEPSDINAHPHFDMHGDIAIVHNGIIENYQAIKERLIQKGCKFVSDTDTEVVAHLISAYYNGDMLATLSKVLPELQGSYALAIICQDMPDRIFCVRKDGPLVLGVGKDSQYLASDIPAILEHTQEMIMLEDYEIAILTRDKIEIYDILGNPVHKTPLHIDWNIQAAEKCGFTHFMLKEIHETPTALRETFDYYTCNNGLSKNFDAISTSEAQALSRITVVACGTAYHAGLVGKTLIERLARIPVDADIASEFRYKGPIVNPKDLCIVLSQSGETADTIAAMREFKRLGGNIIAICNAIGSTITREADHVLYTIAGPEIAVASTKAYVSQLFVLYLLALDIAYKRGNIDKTMLEESLRHLAAMPEQIKTILSDENKALIQRIANRSYNQKNVFFIGRGLDFMLAQEASLKLKEISYINSEAYAAGELKHGTIALIEQDTLVVAIATQSNLVNKTISNIEEVRTRGAKILTVTSLESPELEAKSDYIIKIPPMDDMFAPMAAIVPLQLFAYYVALEKGCDIDKPRNLAKSVTVE